MRYTIRNVQPSVLFIPDAGLRLEAGQTAVVGALTPQMASLLALRVLEVVASDAPSSVPVVTPASLDELSQDTPALAMPIPAGPSSLEVPAEAVTVPPAAEGKRSGRKATESLVTLEPNASTGAVELVDLPSAMPPATHASTHATGQRDALSASAIGADAEGAAAAALASATGALNTHAAKTTDAHGGVVASNDSRLSNARTPTAHASTHATGQSDALTPSAIGAAEAGHTHGQLHDRQHSMTSSSDHAAATGDDKGKYYHTNTATGAVELVDLPSAMPPAAHAASHQRGGADEIATATPTAHAISLQRLRIHVASGYSPVGRVLSEQ